MNILKKKNLPAQLGMVCFASALLVWGLLFPRSAIADGVWTKLNRGAPGPVNLMLLLSDGTVMAQQTGTNIWYRLRPNNGNYVDGTWTTNKPMTSSRLYYSSAVLRDGRVLVAGAEYGNGWNTAEVYSPSTDSWSPAPVPAGLLLQNNNPQPPPKNQNTAGFTDSICKILPNGTVMVAPNFPTTPGGTLIYNPGANSWSAGPQWLGNQNEASWVKLPDDSILTVDQNTLASERFIPSLNVWTNDAPLPVALYDAASELGAAFLLPNGRVIFLGGTGQTAVYTPSGGLSQGAWAPGPVIPGGWGCSDSAAAMLELNGKILCAVGPVGVFAPPTSFYEYDYLDLTAGTNGSFTQVGSPTGGLTDTNVPPGPGTAVIPYQTIMLALPDASILYSDSTTNLYTYVPTGFPRISSVPTINNITVNGDGSYHLTGTRLNGISEGAAYGDDAQMDSNYPLVRAQDGSGNVFYGTTFNWSSTSVATGNTPVSTDFALFLDPGSYSLVAVANGIASDPFTFYGQVWVDFNYAGVTQDGKVGSPYKTLAGGISAVPSTGTIAIKPGLSHETMTISKPMSIIAIGGAATIGQ
jgi:hypothetical protein